MFFPTSSPNAIRRAAGLRPYSRAEQRRIRRLDTVKHLGIKSVPECPNPPYKLGADGKWHKASSRCKSRKCDACGILWAGDQRTKLITNISHYNGDVALLTITAPGADVLPWNRDRTAVERIDAMKWNVNAPEQWRQLHRLACQEANRWHKRNGGNGWAILARVWEFQRRGVLHIHVILPMNTARDRRAAHIYAMTLDNLRQRHNFGFVSDTRRSGSWRTKGLEAIPALRASRYVAKYLAGTKRGGGLVLTETVNHPDVPGHVAYVSRKLTAATRCTMRTLRARRAAWCIAKSAGIEVPQLLALLQAGEIILPALAPLLRRTGPPAKLAPFAAYPGDAARWDTYVKAAQWGLVADTRRSQPADDVCLVIA